MLARTRYETGWVSAPRCNLHKYAATAVSVTPVSGIAGRGATLRGWIHALAQRRYAFLSRCNIAEAIADPA
jgi:hypothetical protein